MTEAKRAEETKKEVRLEREIEIAAPVDEAWRALTDPQQLKNWFPLEARVTPGVGGKMFLSWGPDCQGESQIVTWEPGKKLTCQGQFALIEWTLEARGGKTILRLVQSAFATGADWENEWFDSTQYGWGFMLLSLQWLLERHRGTERKVAWPRVNVNVLREEAYRRLMAPGGISAQDSNSVLREGQEYSLATTAGETFSGRVEFIRPPRGFCISVRELNDALLWLTIEGMPEKIEAQIWLSAFGVQQPVIDSFSKKWNARLCELFPE